MARGDEEATISAGDPKGALTPVPPRKLQSLNQPQPTHLLKYSYDDTLDKDMIMASQLGEAQYRYNREIKGTKKSKKDTEGINVNVSRK